MAWQDLLSAWDAWVLTFVLTVVVPALGYIRFRQLRDRTVPSRMKLTVYGRTVAVQWFLTAAMLLVLRRHGLSVGDAGERLGDARLTFEVTFAVLVVLAVVAPFVLWRVRRTPPERLAAAIGSLRGFVPTFGVEMGAFVMVCLTTGFCEEMLYRGWMVNILRAATGSTWAAVAATSIIFGVGHAYQGVKGMLRTVFVGLQLAILYVWLGSLIPGQVLHAGADLIAGTAGALALSRLKD